MEAFAILLAAAIGLAIGFVAGWFIIAYLAVRLAKTHDYILVDGELRWVERPKKSKCQCTRDRYCDYCWRRAYELDPCPVPGCQNPNGHTGPHGAFNNTGVVTISREEILPAIGELRKMEVTKCQEDS